MERLPFGRTGGVLDPAPMFGLLRDQNPVVKVLTVAGDPAWLVTRHAEVKALLADPRLGRTLPAPERAARISQSALLGGAGATATGPEDPHARMRRLLGPAFAPGRMRMLRGRVAEVVEAALDGMAAAGGSGGRAVDLHEYLSAPVPVAVICELLGVPFADRARFRAWSGAIADLTNRERSAAAMADLTRYVRELIPLKRSAPGEDLLSDLVAGAELTEDEIAGQVAALLFAGHETTVVRIDLGSVLLLRHPRQAAAVAEGGERAARAVEEILRLTGTSTIGGIPRYAQADIEVAGVLIAAGDAVLLSTVAADRDERAYTEPETVELDRSPNPHLAFGFGPYYCLGATLARVELQEVFSRLLRRMPALRLAVPYADLRLRGGLLTGGLEELPVRW